MLKSRFKELYRRWNTEPSRWFCPSERRKTTTLSFIQGRSGHEQLFLLLMCSSNWWMRKSCPASPAWPHTHTQSRIQKASSWKSKTRAPPTCSSVRPVTHFKKKKRCRINLFFDGAGGVNGLHFSNVNRGKGGILTSGIAAGLQQQMHGTHTFQRVKVKGPPHLIDGEAAVLAEVQHICCKIPSWNDAWRFHDYRARPNLLIWY